VVKSHQLRARDAALRRTRGIVAGVAAGAVALSGLVSVVAAQAFKGHSHRAAATPRSTAHRVRAHRNAVPPPDSIPAIAGAPEPLQPPAQPPAAVPEQAPAPAPEPQVSGGS
jgi:hypothetical protein